MSIIQIKIDSYERDILRGYVKRGLECRRARRAKRPPGALVHWVHRNTRLLGVPALKLDDPDDLEFNDSPVPRELLPAIRSVLERLRVSPTATPSAFELRMAWLCDTLSLTSLEGKVLRAAVRFNLIRPLQGFLGPLDGTGGAGEVNAWGLSILTGHDSRAIAETLKAGRPLRLLGLLDDRGGGDVAPSATVLKIGLAKAAGPERLARLLMGKPVRPDLAWEDFAHLGETWSLAESLVAGAFGARAVGINILLYGEPGTGKTEFARTLAARLGARPIFAGEISDDDGEPSRADRLAGLAIGRALAARAGRAILVVDEADDIFTGVDDDDAGSRKGSKVFMNRLVEGTAAPTVWITNHPRRLGPAVLRRMSLAIRFPAPDRVVRRRVAERIARRRKLQLTAAALDDVARIEAPPAIISNAMMTARLSGGGPGALALSARSVVEVLRGAPRPAPATHALAFDPALSAADTDLTRLAERIAASGEMALSFCFHGLPGTGKSAFARHLAQSLGLDVIEKRASDLLSKWVGESEQNIAAAFRDAADRRAVLILDEADSLLRDRGLATHSWEVTQVNEMLTWMEVHPYPFVCTTNLMDSLDPATLRRFLFKVRFLPMTEDQAREAFRRSFGMEAPAEVARLSPLAPADFTVVARKAKLMGVADAAGLVGLLVEEVAVKPQGRRRIGF